jgi:hypothetical protein
MGVLTMNSKGMVNSNTNVKRGLIKLLIFTFVFGLILNTSLLGQASAETIVPRFYDGVTITCYSDYFNIKVDRAALPEGMRNFTMMSVWGVWETSDSYINEIIDQTIQFEYGLHPYIDSEGYNESNPAPNNVVLLFDDNKTPLGYYILDTSGVTISTIKNLLLQFYNEGLIRNKGIYNSLNTKLSNANIDPFVNELNAQYGKGVDANAASILLEMISQLNE